MEMADLNRQVILAGRPSGMPREMDFRVVEAPSPIVGAGDARVRALYLSIDPIRARTAGQNSSVKGVQPGDVVGGAVVGEVLESNDPRVARGDIVYGMLGWQEYAVASAKSLRKIDPRAAPISTALYV